jgi:hypothetical protein
MEILVYSITWSNCGALQAVFKYECQVALPFYSIKNTEKCKLKNPCRLLLSIILSYSDAGGHMAVKVETFFKKTIYISLCVLHDLTYKINVVKYVIKKIP